MSVRLRLGTAGMTKTSLYCIRVISKYLPWKYDRGIKREKWGFKID